MPTTQTRELTARELKDRLERGDRLTLVDVREPFEWDISNLAQYGARLIPLGDLVDRLSELDPAAEIVLYCRTGGRSGGAARHLRANGYARVWNLAGGINNWAREIDPALPTY